MIIRKAQYPYMWDMFVETALDNGALSRGVTELHLDVSPEELSKAERALGELSLTSRLRLSEGPTGEDDDDYDDMVSNKDLSLAVAILNLFFDLDDNPLMDGCVFEEG